MMEADLAKRFTSHVVDEEQYQSQVAIRSSALALAELVDNSQPDSREKSLAITALEECVMWANAGIARNG